MDPLATAIYAAVAALSWYIGRRFERRSAEDRLGRLGMDR